MVARLRELGLCAGAFVLVSIAAAVLVFAAALIVLLLTGYAVLDFVCRGLQAARRLNAAFWRGIDETKTPYWSSPIYWL